MESVRPVLTKEESFAVLAIVDKESYAISAALALVLDQMIDESFPEHAVRVFSEDEFSQ
jgi:hypothetical protein